MPILVTGATGFTGSLFLGHLTRGSPGREVHCLIRPTSDCSLLSKLDLQLQYWEGDSASPQTWREILTQLTPATLVHIASIRHVPVLLEQLAAAGQQPRLVVVGTTGVYSQFNQYSATYRQIEAALAQYPGNCCLLRPTMIYGSQRDKNLHKLIRFCDRAGFFPVFGSGNCLLQPVHADDLAQAIWTAVQQPEIQGAYDLSGGSVVTFRELLALVSQCLSKRIVPVPIPLRGGVWLATGLEQILGRRSPVRREQILRLQEDKAYDNSAARRDLQFAPRSLELGLQQQVDELRQLGAIAPLRPTNL